jgi:hypothetical protein
MYSNVSSSQKVGHFDNPPLFAWAEWENYKLTGDKGRLEYLLHDSRVLEKHFEWFEGERRDSREGYTWDGESSGMDNTPRGRNSGGYHEIYWVDAMGEQALAAYLIAEMAKELGDDQLEAKFRAKHAELSRLLDELYWDDQDGLYYDIAREAPHQLDRIATPTSFWPMLARAASVEQAGRLRGAAMDPLRFGGAAPFPSLVRSDIDFDRDGRYWRGGIWLPTAYMAIQALAAYGYADEADSLAGQLLEYQLATYKAYQPHTIWEAYSPSEPKWATNAKGKSPVRVDFSGWSALGPISMFIQNVLGFRSIDAAKGVVVWNKRLAGRHGIERLRFGAVETEIVGYGDQISVRSSGRYRLIINEQAFEILEGDQSFRLSAPGVGGVRTQPRPSLRVPDPR